MPVYYGQVTTVLLFGEADIGIGAARTVETGEMNTLVFSINDIPAEIGDELPLQTVKIDDPDVHVPVMMKFNNIRSLDTLIKAATFLRNQMAKDIRIAEEKLAIAKELLDEEGTK